MVKVVLVALVVAAAVVVVVVAFVLVLLLLIVLVFVLLVAGPGRLAGLTEMTMPFCRLSCRARNQCRRPEVCSSTRT